MLQVVTELKGTAEEPERNDCVLTHWDSDPNNAVLHITQGPGPIKRKKDN